MLNTVLNKILSGRFIMVVCFTVTACYMAAKNQLQSEAFVGIITLIAREYFDRKDRTEKVEEVKPS